MNDTTFGHVSERDNELLTAIDRLEEKRDLDLPIREYEIGAGRKVELGAFRADELPAVEEDARIHGGTGVMIQVAEHTAAGWKVDLEVGRQEVTQ